MGGMFLTAVIDPKTAEPVPDGETGELVFTTLTSPRPGKMLGEKFVKIATKEETRPFENIVERMPLAHWPLYIF
jgi:hypothetical protein